MQLALTDGSYVARSIIASAQRCVNLYPEVNQLNKTLGIPQQMTSSITTHYPTPGLTLLATVGNGPIRCLYRANNGTLYCASGNGIYALDGNFNATLLGTIGFGITPVSMADNSIQMVIVDGSSSGYLITLSDNDFAQIVDPAFFGADRADYLDTFLLFNKPGTPQFYCTQSGITTPFDALYFANKTAYGDNLVVAVSMHREIWLIGELTTEVWYDTGGALFPFAEVPGAFVQHGCAAKYSVAVQNEAIFWVSQNLQGHAVVLMASGYDVERVSTFAIEQAISQYAVISDAEGFIYQQQGHEFYVLSFPTANKTWVYDIVADLWHERMWLDANGNENRIRPRCHALAHGKNVCGDWQNGNVYMFDVNNYTDNGMPIGRIRSFPTMINELKRVSYSKFLADMQVGGSADGTVEPAPTLTTQTGEPVVDADAFGNQFLISTVSQQPPPDPSVQVGLRYSDDGGATWSNILWQGNGAQGQFNTSMQWRRLGMGRRRVFELRWSAPVPTALNGAYIDVVAANS